jgi:histidinol phosphatase-like enzyme (inositol monophosphatase family)
LPLESLLQFALDAAWQAGRISLGYFQTGIAFERKADTSPVTRADREAEQKIRAMIEHSWPDHGIIGEEFDRKPGYSDLTWIVDPIDGTKSFICGMPIYANLIALTYHDIPVLGVANYPAVNDMVYAARGLGCFWNGRRAHVSTTSTLADAVLLGSDVCPKGEKGEAWGRLCDATYIQRTWGDAYGYAMVATGRADIMMDAVMNVWDCGPFEVILTEAGGTFTDWKGTTTIYGGESLATNGVLRDQVLNVVTSSTYGD